MIGGVDVLPGVRSELDRVKALAEAVRTRQWRGAGNQPITDVVSIGKRLYFARHKGRPRFGRYQGRTSGRIYP